MMIKNEIGSIMLAALVAMVCLFAVAAPVSAGMDVTIDPCRSPPGESPAYICVLNDITPCDIWFVNVTIPEGYTAVDTDNCFCSVNLTLQNESTDEIISKSMAFSNATGHWVEVTHTASNGVWSFVANCNEGTVTNICMGSTSCLCLTMPTATTNGSINISLGALGPVTPGDSMTLEFASGMIKNPTTSGCYTWTMTADPCGYSESGVVCIMHPGDINGDNTVNVFDLIDLANAYKSVPGDANWNQCANLDCNGEINVFDLIALANNYKEDYTIL